jgi:hypothetical protein
MRVFPTISSVLKPSLFVAGLMVAGAGSAQASLMGTQVHCIMNFYAIPQFGNLFAGVEFEAPQPPWVFPTVGNGPECSASGDILYEVDLYDGADDLSYWKVTLTPLVDTVYYTDPLQFSFNVDDWNGVDGDITGLELVSSTFDATLHTYTGGNYFSMYWEYNEAFDGMAPLEAIFRVDDNRVLVASVAEPGTLPSFALGLGMLGLMWRRAQPSISRMKSARRRTRPLGMKTTS